MNFLVPLSPDKGRNNADAAKPRTLEDLVDNAIEVEKNKWTENRESIIVYSEAGYMYIYYIILFDQTSLLKTKSKIG